MVAAAYSDRTAVSVRRRTDTLVRTGPG